MRRETSTLFFSIHARRLCCRCCISWLLKGRKDFSPKGICEICTISSVVMDGLDMKESSVIGVEEGGSVCFGGGKTEPCVLEVEKLKRGLGRWKN